MKKTILLLTCILLVNVTFAQVGIGNTDPKASLDITATNVATPANTDGILIPRVAEFPATNPTAAQDGMLIFITGTGTPNKGFYYWDHTLASWQSVPGANNTLDQAYDEGGAGAGRTITADNGAVAINGTDGFQVTGTHGSGAAITLSGVGTRMFFNPKKAAFRSGGIISGGNFDPTVWDDANVGNYSFASGLNAAAFGFNSTAMGNRTKSYDGGTALGALTTANSNATAMGNGTFAYEGGTATGGGSIAGPYSTSMGSGTITPGGYSTSMGYESTASGVYSTAIGFRTTASGDHSTAMGQNTTALSLAETVVGLYNTTYIPHGGGWYPTDRLFVIGNGTDAANKSNALTIYKNGLMNINDSYNMPLLDGTANQVMATDGAGQVSFVNSNTVGTDDQNLTGATLTGTNLQIDIENGNSATVDLASLKNTLDQAYDEGGAGAGRTINTTDGAVLLNGADGLEIKGTQAGIAIANTTENESGIHFRDANDATQYADINYDNGTNNLLNFYVNSSTSLMTLKDNQRVGIGTTTPSEKLSVAGTANLNEGITAGTALRVNGDEALWYDGTYFSWGFGGSTNYFADNVGIGTSTPSQKLSVAGTANLNEGLNGVALRVNGTEALWYNGTQFSWGFGGTENYFADKVGIGTNSPVYKLDVADTKNADYVAQLYNKSTNANADGLRIRLKATNPNTANYFIGFYDGSDTQRGRITGNGSGVTYNTTSDRRLKTHIVNIDHALEIINKIQPRKYEYKTKLGVEEYGFIAQELQTVYPQAVSGDPNGDVKTAPMMVDYSRLTPILTAGVNELKKEVETIQLINKQQQEKSRQNEEEIKKLKQALTKHYTALEKRLQALENKK